VLRLPAFCAMRASARANAALLTGTEISASAI
jgi:hypothetical protein